MKFVTSQAGDAELASRVLQICKEVEPFLVGQMPALDSLDELLNLID